MIARRARAWLGAAIVVLLTATYLTGWLTYDQVHLPPTRYHQLAPGSTVTDQDADFTLRRLRQTSAFGDDAGSPAAADPGAVWLVADLTVTRHTIGKQYFDCTLTAVGADRREWQTDFLGVSHDGEDCTPDDAVAGKAYPIVAYFQVPAAEAGQIAGLALPAHGWRSQPLLTPPAG